MTTKKTRAARADRNKLSSPGRPGVARREDRRLFWLAIAAGRSSEDAAVEVAVSQPVGSRCFRENGGMAPIHLSPSAPCLSRRYLTFGESEEKAAVFAVISHDLAAKPGRHIAAGTIGEGGDPAFGYACRRMAGAGAAVLVGGHGSACAFGGFRVSGF